MLGDQAIGFLDTHLERFKLNNMANQAELQVILREYSQLLEDYKDLKQAFEEKEARQAVVATPVPVPAAAAGGAAKSYSPYVLVLVDGNGYIFNDELVGAKEDGGMKAARMLSEVVEKYLRDAVPKASNSRIIVRIYADLTEVSKSLARSKVVGLEKRSLAGFAAGFTRSINYFDYVDALDEAGTKFKLQEMFKLATEDSNCSHILLAACHDTSYLPLIVPFSGMRSKITLVQGAGFNSEFMQFNLALTQFPTVFRWSDLPSSAPNTKSSFKTSDRTSTPSSPYKPPSKSTKAIGSGSHSRQQSGLRLNSNADATFGTEAKDGLSYGSINIDSANGFDAPTGPSKTHGKGSKTVPCKYFQKGYCKFGSQCDFAHFEASKAAPTMDRSNISGPLPTTSIPGFISVNKDDQRLDAYLEPPTLDDWNEYNARFHAQKPCNAHHLQNACPSFNCQFDHKTLPPSVLNTLQYVVKCSPCPRKGKCRASDCIYGHICQKNDCQGDQKGCRMKADLHAVDPEPVSWVKAEEDNVYGNGDFGAGSFGGGIKY